MNIDNVISLTINSILLDGEKVVWSGTQSSGRFFQAYLLKALIPILWTVSMIVFAVATNADLHWKDISKWSSFHWVFAFFTLIGPIGIFEAILKFKSKPITIYFISNQRAVVLSGKELSSVATYLPKQLINVVRTEHADGTGDLLFKTERQIDESGDAIDHLHGFFGVQNVRLVERHIIELCRA